MAYKVLDNVMVVNTKSSNAIGEFVVASDDMIPIAFPSRGGAVAAAAADKHLSFLFFFFL
jgi:hypothetical protein